jgi:hypothetical protein
MQVQWWQPKDLDQPPELTWSQGDTASELRRKLSSDNKSTVK